MCSNLSLKTPERHQLNSFWCFYWQLWKRSAYYSTIFIHDFEHVFAYYPASIHLFKVNNENSRTNCAIFSKLTKKTRELHQWRCSSVSHCSGVSINTFELVNAGSVGPKSFKFSNETFEAMIDRCRSSHQRCPVLKVLLKFRKFHRKTSELESLFSKVTSLEKDSNTVFSCEICEIFKSTYFEEHLLTVASVGAPQNRCSEELMNFSEKHP